MTQVVSIFERIGLGGGGKIKAVYARMNAIAEIPEFQPVLFNLHHSVTQKLNFKTLQAEGIISDRAHNITLPEACYDAVKPSHDHGGIVFPAYDASKTKNNRVQYYQNGLRVMVDKLETTPLGTLTKRRMPWGDGERVYHILNDSVHQLVQRNPDGSVDTTDFVNSVPICWTKSQDGNFVSGKNFLSGKVYRLRRMFMKSLFELVSWEGRAVCFDGITSAYLAEVAGRQRTLILHADHRGPAGKTVPRSQKLIESFQGEAIITSTHAHKTKMETDLTPAAPVYVVPHYYEPETAKPHARKDLVTVSRLDLAGKPIHETIAAFCLIMHEFPEVNYVVYGSGDGQEILTKLIDELNCGSRVKLAGYTGNVDRVFQSAIASVYPTLTEGFGLSMLEALFNGCPVISYDVDYGPREMIDRGKNGELVQPGNVSDIAEAMRRVLTHPEQYQAATRQGLEHYTREAFVANYYQIIKRLTA